MRRWSLLEIIRILYNKGKEKFKEESILFCVENGIQYVSKFFRRIFHFILDY